MKINIKVKEVTGRLLSLDEIQSKVNNLYSNAIYSGDAELPESENKMLIQDVASILYTFQQLNQRIAELEKECEHWHGHYQIKSTLADAQAMQLNELESENKALRLIAGSHSMSELRRNRIMAGWKRGDTLKNEVKHE